MTNYQTGLKCVSCSAQFTSREVDYTCPRCGPLLGTLSVSYDYKRIVENFTRANLARNTGFTHWRYLPLLPISRPELIQHLSVGWTPIYSAQSVADELGLRRVWIKDDGRNPSASFKDRASAVAIVKALEKGARTVTAASTGNAASSWAMFAAVAGMEATIFVPEGAPRAKVAQLLLYGAKVIQVRGTYDDAFELCCQAADRWGWFNRSTAINPYLGEGKKTGAFEICEQLNWQVPDYVFVAVGDGCILQGTWKGFQEFHEIGFIAKLPRIIGVQAAGSAPLVQAWEAGDKTCKPLIPATIADSISVGIPRDQVKALRAVRNSGGAFIAVSDSEILDACSSLARRVGVFAEPAGAAAFAGLRRAVASNLLGAGDTAAVMITGNGLKDIDGVLRAVSAQPFIVANSLDAVERILS